MVASARLSIGAGALAVHGGGGGGVRASLLTPPASVLHSASAAPLILCQRGLARGCNCARLLSGMPGQRASCDSASQKSAQPKNLYGGLRERKNRSRSS